jgi:hypothetical protein
MKNKKNILVLLLLLVSTYSILLASTTDITNYKRYGSLDINNSQIDGSIITSSSGVALPIIANYDPYLYELYSVVSSMNESVSIFDGTNISTYNTQDYDITTVGQSEKFTLKYINNLDKQKYSNVKIYYDKEFYSTDREKNSGVSLHLESDSLLVNNDIKLKSTFSGTDNNLQYVQSGNLLNYTSFKFKMKKGYHNASLVDFRFTWTPTAIEDINANSDNNFFSGEQLVAYVFIVVEGA